MKKSRFADMQEEVAGRFPEETGKRIKENMQKEYDRLIAENTDIPEDFVSHTRNNIFPVVSAFNAFLSEGMEREEAAKLADECFLVLMEKIAASIRKILKFPGLYRLMPGIWKTAMPKLFKKEAGFCFNFYPSDKTEVKFDMTACPYYSMCIRLGVPELAPTFCATDDTCYGNMHEKLIWNRTKTIARGGDLCDFDLYIKK